MKDSWESGDPYEYYMGRWRRLILHSIYHRPNSWDYIPPGQKIPCGESTMWGDYHGRELALMILRAARQQPYYTFFSNIGNKLSMRRP